MAHIFFLGEPLSPGSSVADAGASSKQVKNEQA